MSITPEIVERALAQYQDDYLNQGGLLPAIDDIRVSGDAIEVDLTLGFPADSIKDKMTADIKALIVSVTGLKQVTVRLGWAIEAPQLPPNMPTVVGVKNIVAVASGKGGVGKSTTAVNLALALAAEGVRVGLLDADIYGPSQPTMVGIASGTRPQMIDEKFFVPVMAHGLQVMSMGFLVDENTPMVWRGPMVSGALQQLLMQTKWDNVDYLIIDMPPGTGDIQLTLAQKVPVTGAVIVTTPQDIALLDAKKGIEMFRKVNVPIVGVIENMAVHICSQCGHQEHLFGEGGGQRIAIDYQTQLLAALPLDLKIREQTDSGKPTVVAEPNGEISALYKKAARKMTAQLWSGMYKMGSALPTISVVDD
jgi:ATP-binding protein involved in chromosome partitioning